MVGVWYESGIINQVLKNKLIFSESSDQEETAIALSELFSNVSKIMSHGL